MTEQATAVTPAEPIPDKLYFKIGEVAQLVGVQAHVLRYWEKEVPSVRPSKSSSNQRRYRRRDVEVFREIRRLLYEERYTLAGARRRLGGKRASPEDIAPDESMTEAQSREVREQLDLLPQPPAAVLDVAGLRAGLEELVRLAGEEP